MTFEHMLNERERAGIEQGRAEGESIGLKKGRAEGESIGLKKGRAEGESIGLKKGEIKKQREIAKNLKTLKLPMEQITEATGLSAAEIEKL